MEYKNQNLTNYLDDLAARTATPGGGSSAAMTAAMGASLISMVVNFTFDKPKYAAFQNELRDIFSKSERLRKDFLHLVDLDVVAYQSKDIRKAIDVPLMLARLCSQAAKLCPVLIKKGNINLISDVAVAAILLESAFSCACFNIEINLKNLGDRKLSQGITKELSKLAKVIQRIRINTEARVGKVIRG